MLPLSDQKSIRILRKIIFAILFAFLLALLGIFDGVGYYLYYIDERSFVPHNRLGYADVVFSCDIIYNPILYPLYWITGNGDLSGNFSIKYVPEGYYPGEFGGPIWGLSKEDRYASYVIHMLTWGIVLNFFILFSFNMAIEIVGKRSLYLILLCGVCGFIALKITGMIVGLSAGFAIVMLLMFKFQDNFLVRWWQSVWE